MSSTCGGGVPMQWSADATERCNITEIKDPSHSTNNQNYKSQICCYLDHNNKCKRFDLATAICQAQFNINFQGDGHPGFNGPNCGGYGLFEDGLFEDEEGQLPKIETSTDLLACIQLATPASRNPRQQTSYFNLTNALEKGQYPQAPKPY